MIVKDIGDKTAPSLYGYFHDKDSLRILTELLGYLTIESNQSKVVENVKDNPFKGKKVYCTGTFASTKKAEQKALIEACGGEFANGFSKSLDFLVIGSVKGSSKEQKANGDQTYTDMKKLISDYYSSLHDEYFKSSVINNNWISFPSKKEAEEQLVEYRKLVNFCEKEVFYFQSLKGCIECIIDEIYYNEFSKYLDCRQSPDAIYKCKDKSEDGKCLARHYCYHRYN
jgi:hypothetical protein